MISDTTIEPADLMSHPLSGADHVGTADRWSASKAAVRDHDEPRGRTVAAIWPQLQITGVIYSDVFQQVYGGSGL